MRIENTNNIYNIYNSAINEYECIQSNSTV